MSDKASNSVYLKGSQDPAIERSPELKTETKSQLVLKKVITQRGDTEDKQTLLQDDKQTLVQDDKPPTLIPDDKQASQAESKPKEDPTFEFKCNFCSLKEKCHYKGKKPPFVRKIHLLEDSYVMKDPFSPPADGKTSCIEKYLVLGSDCAFCDRPVCKGLECSFFYYKTFCRECLSEHIKQFPLEIQPKIRKQLTLTK